MVAVLFALEPLIVEVALPAPERTTVLFPRPVVAASVELAVEVVLKAPVAVAVPLPEWLVDLAKLELDEEEEEE